jgi:hypothetical protein
VNDSAQRKKEAENAILLISDGMVGGNSMGGAYEKPANSGGLHTMPAANVIAERVERTARKLPELRNSKVVTLAVLVDGATAYFFRGSAHK